MYRKDLIKRISQKTGVAEFDVDLTLRELATVLAEGAVPRETILCTGLFRAKYVVRKPKLIHLSNFKKTGQKIIPEKTILVLRVSDDLQRAVNDKAKEGIAKKNAT